jgi:hypothetical protein
LNLPSSIQEISRLPEPEKRAIYCQLIPDWIYQDYHIDPDTLLQYGEEVVSLRCPAGSRAMEMTIRWHPHELDPLCYINMIDTFNQQLMVLLVVINDPTAPRFNVDVDLDGHSTQFGTSSRNLPEETRAMEAGLAPGQVRRGLRQFRNTFPEFEDFVHRMGHDLFLIEPLAYHNAVVFERYGFAYTHGKTEMKRIDAEFQPGGELHKFLDGSTPFRQPEAWQSARGRSWAIHDGALGHPFTGFRMYKRIGVEAGVQTFTGERW